MSSIAERIIQARKSRGLSQELLAERMHISRGACGHWERGKALPSTDHLQKLAEVLNVRIDWLISGHGNMEYDLHISEPSSSSYTSNINDADTQEVAERYFRLSKKKRKIILDLLREL